MKSAPVPSAVATPEQLLETRTRAFIDQARHGDFTGASASFDTTMRAVMPPAKLEATWRALEAQAGPLQSVDHVTFKRQGAYRLALASARFEKGNLVVKVVYDAHDEIAGLFFVPPEVPWTAASYAKTDAFTESEVSVGNAPALPGTLSMPHGDATVPGVVLVHGSGPVDRDESVGGIKVFKDLAGGLASRGIAVLRYDKRTRQSPAGVVTEKEEVLDGAHEALALLRRTPRVDANRVFVIGHSQGGYLAPRIAKENPGLAGVVILAGPTRPLQDSLLDQLRYFASLHPENAELETKIEQARALKQQVEDPNLQPGDKPRSPIGGEMTGAYFLFQRGYDPVATARALSAPILILQGDRDYQVTAPDLAGWKKGLGGAKNATIKTYASLNHLFVRGEGPPRPEEYEAAGHVDDEVIADIAAWLTKRP